MQQVKTGLGVLMVALATGAAQCPTTGSVDGGPIATNSTGCGTVSVGGTEGAYALDTEASSLLMLLPKNNSGAGCTLFHNHTIRARSVTYTYALNKDTPANSTLTATVFVAGLDNDDPGDFDEFPETSGGEVPPQRDRGTIRVNMMEEVDVQNHAEMTFTATNLSTLEGTGTANLEVGIKGRTSMSTLNATAVWEAGVLTITGTATLNGRAHDVPRASEGLNRCIKSDMPLKLKLVFRPVPSCTVDQEAPDAGARYQPTFIPPTGDCAATTGFHTVDPALGLSPQDVFLFRCGGCHTDPALRFSKVPLVTFENLRTDTAAHMGVPRAQVAVDFSNPNRDPMADGLAMPPPADGIINPDEWNLIKKWLDEGGHRTHCDGATPAPVPAPRTLAPIARANCAPPGTPSYQDVAIRCFFGAQFGDGGFDPACDFNNFNNAQCSGCHAQESNLLVLTSYQGGLRPTDHAFYKTTVGVLTDGGTLYPGVPGWQAALLRVVDPATRSMPLGGLAEDSNEPIQDRLDLIEQWVNAGFPEAPCP